MFWDVSSSGLEVHWQMMAKGACDFCGRHSEGWRYVGRVQRCVCARQNYHPSEVCGAVIAKPLPFLLLFHILILQEAYIKKHGVATFSISVVCHPPVGLNNPYRSFPTWDILIPGFCDSMPEIGFSSLLASMLTKHKKKSDC